MTLPPLSARAQAMTVLDAVLGACMTLDEALNRHPLRGSEADVKFARLLVHSCLRHLGQLDAVIARYLEKPLPPKRLAVTHALRLGAAQLLLLDTPSHAAVNETVNLIKKGKHAGLSGLLNAVLQKMARDRPPLPSASHNVPDTVRARWRHYGKDALERIAAIAAERPPLDLNTQANTIPGTRLDAQILRLAADHAPVETLAGYEEGAFFVQDLAASYPVRLLGDVRGLDVLDLCAAPGGKAAQLARAGAKVTALDRSAARMQVLKENMARLRYVVQEITVDLLEWQPGVQYDAILLDAPCSATGTWRRHPEVVHIVQAKDIAELAALQRVMLARAWSWLKPGGNLVYCVCSLELEEGEAQAEWFLAQHPEARAVPPMSTTGIPESYITPQGYLRTLPLDTGHAAGGGLDGFFAVLLHKALP